MLMESQTEKKVGNNEMEAGFIQGSKTKPQTLNPKT